MIFRSKGVNYIGRSVIELVKEKEEHATRVYDSTATISRERSDSDVQSDREKTSEEEDA